MQTPSVFKFSVPIGLNQEVRWLLMTIFHICEGFCRCMQCWRCKSCFCLDMTFWMRLYCTAKVDEFLLLSSAHHCGAARMLEQYITIQLIFDSSFTADKFDGPWLSQCHISSQFYQSNEERSLPPEEAWLIWENECRWNAIGCVVAVVVNSVVVVYKK